MLQQRAGKKYQMRAGNEQKTGCGGPWDEDRISCREERMDETTACYFE